MAVLLAVQPMPGDEMKALLGQAWSTLEWVVIKEKESLPDGDREPPHVPYARWTGPPVSHGPWIAG